MARKAKPPAAKKPQAGGAVPKRGPGRPSIYSDDLADRICGLIANDWSIRQIGAREDMPDDATITRWLGGNEEFAAKCARAREAQADYVFGQAAELEDKVLDGQVTPDVARVVFSSRQWRASKLAPKRYGDKQQIEHAGSVEIKRTELTPEERIARIAELREKLGL